MFRRLEDCKRIPRNPAINKISFCTSNKVAKVGSNNRFKDKVNYWFSAELQTEMLQELTYLKRLKISLLLILYTPISQNSQTHSNKFSKLPTNCLNVFGHFVGLALKGLKKSYVFFSMRLFIEDFRNIENS